MSEGHTPLRLPVRVAGDEPTLIVDAKGMAVAAIIGDHIRSEKLAELKRQAAAIVTAVNERPALLSRLRKMEEALRAAESGLASSYQVCDYPANGRSEQDRALAIVRAALSE